MPGGKAYFAGIEKSGARKYELFETHRRNGYFQRYAAGLA
jgi:hypothetical protein